jgi:hypothetical protein
MGLSLPNISRWNSKPPTAKNTTIIQNTTTIPINYSEFDQQ